MKLKIETRKLFYSDKIINFSGSNVFRKLKTNNKYLELLLNELTIYKR
jgi:hypothetical protein